MVQATGHACHVQEAVVLTAFSYCYLQTGKQDNHTAMALRQGKQTPGFTDANTGMLLLVVKVFISDTSQSKSTNLSTHQLDAFSEKTMHYQILL